MEDFGGKGLTEHGGGTIFQSAIHNNQIKAKIIYK